jgi:hypothetical protein
VHPLEDQLLELRVQYRFLVAVQLQLRSEEQAMVSCVFFWRRASDGLVSF